MRDTVVSYRNSTSNHNSDDVGENCVELYLIEILHQTTTRERTFLSDCGCILSKFYIKPQLNSDNVLRASSLYLIEILHQTTTYWWICERQVRLYLIEILHQTTTYRCVGWGIDRLYLIEILHQTTTGTPAPGSGRGLYLIEILHQTTTKFVSSIFSSLLYLIEILHQTTTSSNIGETLLGCILSKFYIKPQLRSCNKRTQYVVSYRNSTSNHNPQLLRILGPSVVSYRNSTSNHNNPKYLPNRKKLYLIEILHQTTTAFLLLGQFWMLYLIEILHQTTTNVFAFSFLEELYLIEILHQTTTAKAG